MKKLLTILFLCSFAICEGQTRMYFNTNVTADISPAFNAGWNVTTGASRYRLILSKRGTGYGTRTTSAVGAAAVRKVLGHQFVGDFMAAQTWSAGTTVGMQMKTGISSTSSTTGQGFAYVRICNSSGTITQELGTMTTTNLTTTQTNRTYSLTISGSTSISAGDRLVIEIGGNYSVGTNTTRTFNFQMGNDRNADLAVANTGTGTEDSWIELSANVSFIGTKWYVDPSGSDTNAGTIGSPFRNWQKLTDVADAGDSCFFRGGTYAPTTAMSIYIHCYWRYLKGNSASRIVFTNYPGEVPIYDFAGAVCTEASGNAWMIYMEDCDYMTITGLRARNIKQAASGAGVSRGWAIADGSSNNILNYCTIDSAGGTGFVLGNNSDDNTFNYCDSYNNSDPNSTPDPWGGADGFSVSSVNAARTTFNYCRAWWNSDDGFDNYNIDGVVRYSRCQAFWNGYQPETFTTGGNGKGFKLGPTATNKSADTLRFLDNCLAFKNREDGFTQNVAQCLFVMYNNGSYDNGRYGYQWVDYNTIVCNFKNNWGYANTTADLNQAGSNVPLPYNSWNGTITVSDADFLSVSSVGMDGARSIGGSLPNLNFLKLASGSDLINTGTDVGYGNDLGPFPFVGSTRYKGRIF